MKDSRADKVFSVVNTALVLLITFCIGYPLYFALIASFSDQSQVALGNTIFWIRDFTLSSYRAILNYEPFWRSYGNSIIYTVSGVLFNLFLTLPTAYVLSKRSLPGRRFLNWIFIFVMYFQGGMVPTFVTMDSLGLVGKPIIIVLLGGLSVYNLLVCRAFLEQTVPQEVYEAARLDGASELRQFWHIVLPLSGAIIAVLSLYYAVERWNDYFNALVYLNTKEQMPLQVILRELLIINERTLDLKYASVFVASLPMLMIYPFVQRFFTKGVLMGSLKS
ncbi:MAG: carbohydrate ABC transporter permease [Ruminococcaceae bacterium]|nr:carbohydrate ABC transporter permease [Oscillospiraceae bacterium]